MKRLLYIVILSFGFSATAQNSAPNFIVIDIEGETHELYEYLSQDKYVVVNFMGTWSGPDQDIAQDFGLGFIEFGCNNFDVIFISIDTGSDTQACLDFEEVYMPGVQGLPMISGYDGGGDSAHNTYGITGVPTIITVNPNDSTFTETHLGFYDFLAEQGIEPISPTEYCEFDYTINGCTDENALNYNTNANADNGTCEYSSVIYDSLNNVILDATTSLSSLQQALDTWNTTIDLAEGWNMFGYGCPEPLDVAEGLSNHTESIIIVKDYNGAVYMTEFGFNGIGNLTPGFGYQIKVTEAIEGFSLCDWYVNDIPEDNIVSLQEEVEDLTLEIKCLTNPEIGDNCFGGVIFYYDSNDDKGIIVSQAQVAATQWGCYETEILGANGTAIGTGLQNTLDIVAGCSEQPIAASECLDYENEGFDDWYLPSIDELLLIYSNVGPQSMYDLEFQFNFHWSSTEIDSNIADDFHFGLPNSYTGNVKNGGSYVRAIRYFGNWTEGCIDEAACNYNSEVNLPNSTLCDYVQEGFDCDGNELISYQVGDMAEGGIVFYIDETGEHGLIAAPEDLGHYVWGCNGTNISGADGTEIGTGLQNSLDILAQCSETSIAAGEALAYETNGYDDWYLPSRDELLEIGVLVSLGLLIPIEYGFYVSSSESDNNEVIDVSFPNGTAVSGTASKTNIELGIRPIRSF